MYLLYNIFFLFFALFYLPIFILKGKFGKNAGSRFGLVPESVRDALSTQAVIWVHAVSVGEIALAVRFVDRMRERMPDARFLITTTTRTGFEIGRKIKNEEDTLLYFPIDFRSCVRRFFNATEPSALILFETELWPNVLREASRRSVPVMILNGRISDKAYGSYMRVRFFLRGMFRYVTGISAQNESMRKRFIALGAHPLQVTVNGNMKYDWEPSSVQEKNAAPLKRALRSAGGALWVAGSTHEGEEEILFRVHEALRAKHPQLRLLIAPRHLDRLNAIERSAARAHARTERFSSALRTPSEPGTVWLLDKLGALAYLYECAQIVFVGGSLVPVGGHNLIEPAYFGKPILFGPHMNNFLDIAREFKASGAAIETADEAALRSACEQLLNDGQRRQEIGETARRLIRSHQGATQKSLEWVSALLSSNERSFVKV